MRTRFNIIYDNNSRRTSHDVESLLLDTLNGLDGYSNRFWIDHVIAFLGCTNDNAQLTTMIKVLDEASLTWRRDRPCLSQGKDHPAIKNISLLQPHPAALELICQVLAFRQKSINQEETLCDHDCMTFVPRIACTLTWAQHIPPGEKKMTQLASISLKVGFAMPLRSCSLPLQIICQYILTLRDFSASNGCMDGLVSGVVHQSAGTPTSSTKQMH